MISFLRIPQLFCIRYMLLAVENKEQKDDRAHGGLFYLLCDVVAVLDFNQSGGRYAFERTW